MLKKCLKHEWKACWKIVRVFQDSTPTAVVTTSSVSTLIITVVLCVVLFLICRYILSRRLNLS